MGFENEYTSAITDLSTVYTSVVMNGKRKVIRNYADTGPASLRAVEQRIDKIMSAAKWDSPKPEKKQDQKK